MTNILYATFDGEVLRPEEPISLEPGTRVRITVETDFVERRKTGAPHSALDAMLAARINGPPDWSTRRHYYLSDEEFPCDE
jgi:predicted DNA-binding antitoxin AbrB/MazE fold protein